MIQFQSLKLLNPIQPLAEGMDSKELGDEFGQKITFYGGYIVAPSHGFQPDTSVENILAMYEAVLGYIPSLKTWDNVNWREIYEQA